jgi:hypothetical protein
LFNTFDELFEQIRWAEEAKKKMEVYDRIMDTKKTIRQLAENSTFFSVGRGLQDLFSPGVLSAIEDAKSRYDSWSKYEEVFKESRLTLSPNLTAILREATHLSGVITMNQSILSQILPVAGESHILPETRIRESFATLAALTEYYNAPPFMYQSAIQNTLTFQKFVSAQLLKIAKDSDEVAKRRATVIDLAGELFDLSEDTIGAGFIYLEDIDDEENEMEEEFIETTSNLFSSLNQHLSYVYRNDREVDIDDLEENFFASLPAQISKNARKLIFLVIEINSYAERRGDKPIFKPTTRNMEACFKIPNSIVRNECDFSKIVCLLYNIIYEGAGASSNRLVNQLKLSESNLEPLWILKHLRLDIAHDVDHGNEIEKKFLNIGNAYNYLIGKSKPRSGRDYLNAQLKLYRSLNAMLEEALKILS